MKHVFDVEQNRRGSASVKWDCMDILSDTISDSAVPLWVADMDFASPKAVVEALHKRVDDGIFGYTSFESESYLNAVTSWMDRRFDWKVEKADIFVTQGIVHALDKIIELYTNQGDGVIIQEPVYYPFRQKIEKNKCKAVNNQLVENDGYYTIDFDDLLKKAQEEDNTMMIFCSPHNPVGRVWNESELKKVAQICLENDVILVSDEIHFDLLRKGVKHYPITKLVDDDRIIVCTAPSKTFNLAGMQCSNIIIRNEEQKRIWNEEFGVYKLVNPLSAVAIEAAYKDGEEWVEQLNVYLEDNIQFTIDYLKEHLPKVKCLKPEGTYLMWLDFRAYKKMGLDITDLMIKKAEVLLDPGDMFGESGAGYQRINIGCPRSILTRALNKMAAAIHQAEK